MERRHQDELYMRRCLQLAACGRMESRPNPMVGAVIVAGDRMIGEGYHVRCGEGHAEVNAFASVSQEDEKLLPEATIYVSLEPCSHYGKTPPCADLIISKGVRRVVVGCTDPFAKVQGRGIEKLREAGIDVTTGVLEGECRWTNRRFLTFHSLQRPYIILKYARTKDGFLDDHGRAAALSTSFTRMLVHRLRAEEDAIVVGRVTWEREHPRLDVRHWAGPSPRRFVLGGKTGDTEATESTGDRYRMVGSVEELIHACREEQLQSLVVEGGRQTLQSFIEDDLWDEIRVETASFSVGEGTPAPTLPANCVLRNEETYGQNDIQTFGRQMP